MHSVTDVQLIYSLSPMGLGKVSLRPAAIPERKR